MEKVGARIMHDEVLTNRVEVYYPGFIIPTIRGNVPNNNYLITVQQLSMPNSSIITLL